MITGTVNANREARIPLRLLGVTGQRKIDARRLIYATILIMTTVNFLDRFGAISLIEPGSTKHTKAEI